MKYVIKLEKTERGESWEELLTGAFQHIHLCGQTRRSPSRLSSPPCLIVLVTLLLLMSLLLSSQKVAKAAKGKRCLCHFHRKQENKHRMLQPPMSHFAASSGSQEPVLPPAKTLAGSTPAKPVLSPGAGEKVCGSSLQKEPREPGRRQVYLEPPEPSDVVGSLKADRLQALIQTGLDGTQPARSCPNHGDSFLGHDLPGVSLG